MIPETWRDLEKVLEPVPSSDSLSAEHHLGVSIAISLKRIADALEHPEQTHFQFLQQLENTIYQALIHGNKS